MIRMKFGKSLEIDQHLSLGTGIQNGGLYILTAMYKNTSSIFRFQFDPMSLEFET